MPRPRPTAKTGDVCHFADREVSFPATIYGLQAQVLGLGWASAVDASPLSCLFVMQLPSTILKKSWKVWMAVGLGKQ